MFTSQVGLYQTANCSRDAAAANVLSPKELCVPLTPLY